jgi:hypothetical protein
MLRNKMLTLIFLGLALPLSISSNSTNNEFLSSQKSYPRVRAAISEKEEVVSGFLKKSGFELNDINILFIALKEEKQLSCICKKKIRSHL